MIGINEWNKKMEKNKRNKWENAKKKKPVRKWRKTNEIHKKTNKKKGNE